MDQNGVVMVLQCVHLHVDTCDQSRLQAKADMIAFAWWITEGDLVGYSGCWSIPTCQK